MKLPNIHSKSGEIEPTAKVHVSINSLRGGESIKYTASVVMSLGGIDNASNIGDMIDEYISVCEISEPFYEEYHRRSLNELHIAYRENSETRQIALDKMRNFLKSQIRREQLRKLI